MAGEQLLLTLDATASEACSSTADPWDDRRIVLTDGATTRPRLRAVTAGAAREGVRAGMSLSEARALCGDLDVLPWNQDALDRAIVEATAAFVRASPQVSPVAGSPGMWWIGASGFAVGGTTAGGRGEGAFARALRTIASAWHPQARVAVADTCVAARAATWASLGRSDERALARVIPRGGDAAYLASAPLTLLPMESEMRDALRALGVRTVGAFAELDAGDVEQRWGDDGLTAWRLACGDDPRRPVLAQMDEQLRADLELATPAATMEPVLFLVRPAVETLTAELVARGRAIASLAITLTLDDARGALPTARAHTITREIRLPRPLARPAPLFERCRGLLSRWELSAPVTAVRLTVLITSPLAGEQGSLLDTSWRDPGAADAALERVRAEMGPDVVVKPHARDAHVIERSGIWREDTATDSFSAGTLSSAPASRGGFSAAVRTDQLPRTDRGPQKLLAAPAENHLTQALRLLEAPELVDVDADDTPSRIFWRGRAIVVINALGPERLSGDWWNDGFGRDYWRCESDDDHGELMLYRDAAGWWVQGWYD